MRRSRAFTLPELLVVVGIIALLMGLLFPSLCTVRQAAQQAVCLNALRQHGAAALLYHNLYRTYLPAKIGVPDGTPVPQPPTVPFVGWCYMEEYHRLLGIPHHGSLVPSGLICPRASLAFQYAHPLGFQVNYSYGYNYEGLPWNTNPPVYYTGYRQGAVRSPAEKLMLADATDWVIAEWNSGGYLTYGEQYGAGPLHNLIAYRHASGANILFFDGHVERLPQEQVINNDRLWKPMN